MQFVDPEKRISLPPVEPGGGWQAAAFLPGSRLNLADYRVPAFESLAAWPFVDGGSRHGP